MCWRSLAIFLHSVVGNTYIFHYGSSHMDGYVSVECVHAFNPRCATGLASYIYKQVLFVAVYHLLPITCMWGGFVLSGCSSLNYTPIRTVTVSKCA